MIQEQEKSIYVQKMFSNIASKYDLLNNLMTLSCHYKWKEETIKLALKENEYPNDVLDICTGTGDLAFILNKYCLNPDVKIHCVDNCNEMLNIAKEKVQDLKISNITFESMDTENLTFKPNSFDMVTVGFGIRNLVNREKCIKNIFSLLRDKGVFACIDLGHPMNPIWKSIFNFYFYHLVPKLGELFARDKEAYTYLPNSLRSWYGQEEFKNLILSSGFSKCYFKNIFGGVIAIHIAVK